MLVVRPLRCDCCYLYLLTLLHPSWLCVFARVFRFACCYLYWSIVSLYSLFCSVFFVLVLRFACCFLCLAIAIFIGHFPWWERSQQSGTNKQTNKQNKQQQTKQTNKKTKQTKTQKTVFGIVPVYAPPACLFGFVCLSVCLVGWLVGLVSLFGGLFLSPQRLERQKIIQNEPFAIVIE